MPVVLSFTYTCPRTSDAREAACDAGALTTGVEASDDLSTRKWPTAKANAIPASGASNLLRPCPFDRRAVDATRAVREPQAAAASLKTTASLAFSFSVEVMPSALRSPAQRQQIAISARQHAADQC